MFTQLKSFFDDIRSFISEQLNTKHINKNKKKNKKQKTKKKEVAHLQETFLQFFLKQGGDLLTVWSKLDLNIYSNYKCLQLKIKFKVSLVFRLSLRWNEIFMLKLVDFSKTNYNFC